MHVIWLCCSAGLQQCIASQPHAEVHFMFFRKQLHPAVLHFDLQPQVTSSRQTSGIGGSLDHTACMPSDSFFQARVLVGDATSICSLSACNQILAWWFARAAWSSKASLVGGNISRALLPFPKRWSLACSTVGCAGVPYRWQTNCGWWSPSRPIPLTRSGWFWKIF